MGEVFVAGDPRLGRRVAIKVVSTDFNAEGADERLLREAQTASARFSPTLSGMAG